MMMMEEEKWTWTVEPFASPTHTVSQIVFNESIVGSRSSYCDSICEGSLTSDESLDNILPVKSNRKRNKRLSSSSSLSVRRQTKHANNEVNRRVFLLPRILKHDIRRDYATMFCNVYNSCDFDLTMQYLQTFCRPDSSYVMRKIPLHDESKANMVQDVRMNVMLHHLNAQVANTEACRIQGLEGLGVFWYQHMQESPDYVFKIHQTQMKIKSDHTGCVTFNFSIEDTIVVPSDEYYVEQRDAHLPSKYEHLVSKTSPLFQEQDQGIVRDVLDHMYQAKDTVVQVYDIDGKLFDFHGVCPSPEAMQHLRNKKHWTAILKSTALARQQEQPPINTIMSGENKTLQKIPNVTEGSICIHFDADSRIYFIDYHILETERFY